MSPSGDENEANRGKFTLTKRWGERARRSHEARLTIIGLLVDADTTKKTPKFERRKGKLFAACALIDEACCFVHRAPA